MKPTLVAAVAAMTLAGCATTGSAPDQAAAPSGAMACKADAAQSYIGQQASQVTGTAILKDSGARTLRWGPPNSAWTMDFREDRVNVRYDDTMKITDITCG
jgi:Peptidase inhibitor I78 family